MNGANNNSSITGKITHVLELQSGDSKKNPGQKWYKQEYVLETFAEWPRQVCFQLWGEDKIRQADIQLGDVVTVQFELSSREYNGRWYTSVDGRFVTKGDMSQIQGGYGTPQQAQYPPQQSGYAPQQGQYGQSQYGQAPNFGPAQGGMPNTGTNFGADDAQDDLPF